MADKQNRMKRELKFVVPVALAGAVVGGFIGVVEWPLLPSALLGAGIGVLVGVYIRKQRN